MRCLHPLVIPHRGQVPCGKCVNCSINRQKDWAMRLIEENKHCAYSMFFTLTYNDECLTYSNEGFPIVVKRDIQLWLKRFRKELEPIRIRYFICSEYGPNTLRPHYHGIIFFSDYNRNVDSNVYRIFDSTWNKGFFTLSTVSDARCAYVAKYCASTQLLPPHLQQREFRPFYLMSRNPGIGSGFLTHTIRQHYYQNPSTYRLMANGVKQAFPRYYKEKLYDDDKKAELRLRSDLYLEETYNKKLYEERNKTHSISDMLYFETEKIEAYERSVVNQIKLKSKL